MFLLLVVMLGRPCSNVQCKTTGYPLHSHVPPSLPLPCVTVCHQVSTELYTSGRWKNDVLTEKKKNMSQCHFIHHVTYIVACNLFVITLIFYPASFLFAIPHNIRNLPSLFRFSLLFASFIVVLSVVVVTECLRECKLSSR